MSGLSNYPPGVTGAMIEEFFVDGNEETCNECGELLNIDEECENSKCPTNNVEEK